MLKQREAGVPELEENRPPGRFTSRAAGLKRGASIDDFGRSSDHMKNGLWGPLGLSPR